MNVFVFLLFSLLVNLVLATFSQMHEYRRGQRVAIFGLAVLLPATAAIGHWSAVVVPDSAALLGAKFFLVTNVLVTLFLIEFVANFLREPNSTAAVQVQGFQLPPRWIYRTAAVVAACMSLTPGWIVRIRDNEFTVTAFPNSTVAIIQLLGAVFAVYLLENTYRFGAPHQRKIGRICFLSLLIIGVYQIGFYIRLALFKTLPGHFSEVMAVVYAICYPITLTGLLRYRLGTEKVSVPREIVYSSATLLLTGAGLLAIGTAAVLFRWLQLDFSYFEQFLLVFSLCIFIALAIGSGTMRKRIIRFVNRTFYLRKYDYRQQFFHLHNTLMTGTDLQTAVTNLVENMKYAVTVDDAFVFFQDHQSGDYYLQENKERGTAAELILKNDCELVKTLAEIKTPIDLLDRSRADGGDSHQIFAETAVTELKIDAIFPILNRDELLGVLGLRGGRSGAFDEEDIELIAVFTNCLGDLLFKNRVVTERIEQKQFESFNHVASFMIHDIKNQVATLSLILKNADKNISIPSFQESMLKSVKSCAGNLEQLIGRLAVAPRRRDPPSEPCNLAELITEVADASRLSTLSDLEFSCDDVGAVHAAVDKQSLFFVLKNLVQNALEAMECRGKLRVSLGRVAERRDLLSQLFPRSRDFLDSCNVYIMVEDDGPGMSRHYVRDRLFRPFATTKEKGVGIGLYQCKTLVEQMRGRILCNSQVGDGTKFCILLN